MTRSTNAVASRRRRKAVLARAKGTQLLGVKAVIGS